MVFHRRYGKIIIFIVLIIGLLIYNLEKTSTQNSFELEKHEEVDDIHEEVIQQEYIIVHLDGNISNKGILTLEKGSRLNDAIEKAGGLLENTDTTSLNLAMKLEDEDKIYIPKIGEVIEGTSGITDSNETRIDINNCTKEDLMNLPGIGSKKADMIIDYRQGRKFEKIEDIMEVSGVGEKTFEGFKELIYVR